MLSNRLVAIRRFPVKSMGGEALEHVQLMHRGIAGDRAYAVIGRDGRFASGKNGDRFRRLDGIFGYRAWTASDDDARDDTADANAIADANAGAHPGMAPDARAEPSVYVRRERRIRHTQPSELASGDPELPAPDRRPRRTAPGPPEFVDDPAGPWRIDDPALLADLVDVVGADLAIYRTSGTDFYDASPLSLVGTATVEWAQRELGAADTARRLRANLLVATSEPFEEETWVGGLVRIGGDGALCSVDRVIGRCRMIDLPQDGVERQARFLQALADVRGPRLAVYLRVLKPGRITAGDEVTLDW